MKDHETEVHSRWGTAAAYTNDYVAVKWFDDCQTALAHFGEVSA